MTDKEFDLVKLWFFRDLRTTHRLSLFQLLGYPVHEMGNQSAQSMALRHLLLAEPNPPS